MSYEQAMEKAGAEIHAFEQFGSYQGDWWALVTYKGNRGWVNGSYGSCSGCDAFEAEFDYGSEKCEEHRWQYEKNSCAACEKAAADRDTKLAEFGAQYLDDLLSDEIALEHAKRNIEWDGDAHLMVEFIERNITKEPTQ